MGNQVQKHSTLVRTVAALMAALMLNFTLAACGGELTGGEGNSVHLLVESTDGSRQELSGSYEKLVTVLLSSVPEFLADGVLTQDPARLLTATRIELIQEKLVLERDGQLLRRLEPVVAENDAGVAEVLWDEGLNGLKLNAYQRVTTVTVDGVEPQDRPAYLGRLALAALAGEGWLEPEPELADGRQPQAVIAVVFAVLGAAWLTLQVICEVKSEYRCRHRGGVKNLSVRVTAGLGSGRYKGFCQYSCRR